MPRNTPVPSSSHTAPSEAESFESIARKMLIRALALHSEQRPLATPEIRECVRGLSTNAKARGVNVETMLIELKRVWYTIAESGPHPKSDVVSPLVTMCIKEYYRADRDSSDS